MKSNEFRCAACQGVFEKAWTDEEAKQEAKDNFGKSPEDWNGGAAMVCDDCFSKMHPSNHPELVAKAKINL